MTALGHTCFAFPAAMVQAGKIMMYDMPWRHTNSKDLLLLKHCPDDTSEKFCNLIDSKNATVSSEKTAQAKSYSHYFGLASWKNPFFGYSNVNQQSKC